MPNVIRAKSFEAVCSFLFSSICQATQDWFNLTRGLPLSLTFVEREMWAENMKNNISTHLHEPRSV